MEDYHQDFHKATRHDGFLAKEQSKPVRAPARKHSNSKGSKQAISAVSASRKHTVGASRKHPGKLSVSKKHSVSRVSPTKSSKNVTFRKHHLSSPENSEAVAEMTSKGSPPALSTRGLRQMSVKICEKVKASGKTTCNEVADELLHIIKNEQAEQEHGRLCDDKNIRRRLYDALNVLEAVDVIEKENKDITWKGMPDDDHGEYKRLVSEHEKRARKIHQKEEELRERLVQHVCYRNLVRYNKRRAHLIRSSNKIPLPFVIMNAHPYAEVHCDASLDLTRMMVDLNAPFALHDDNSILRHMGLDQTTIADLEELIPSDMLEYSMKRGLLRGIVHATGSRKRTYSASRMAAAKLALPKESWAQPRPSKRFKSALKKRGR